jgi:acetolactate synthase-1/2/3 large subunit
MEDLVTGVRSERPRPTGGIRLNDLVRSGHPGYHLPGEPVDLRGALRRLLFSDDGTRPDPLWCTLFLTVAGGVTAPDERALVDELCDGIQPEQLTLTGAEAVAYLLWRHGVQTVFAYPGTSELALCDSVDRLPDLRLVSSRGDRECAFMAAGASFGRPNRGVAVVHGARGLTNASGALAAARRNEVGTLLLVGLPSTGSARFLPPHAEPDLITTIGAFAAWSWEAPAVPAGRAERLAVARDFVDRLHDALGRSACRPACPSVFGVPQDVAEGRWVPLPALLPPAGHPRQGNGGVSTAADRAAADRAAAELGAASRPLFFIDDYALRYPGVRLALDDLSALVGAPVLQLRYRRGPMLFERLRQEEVGNFVGWYNPFSTEHTALLAGCDLLVTVEDRNLYPRVVGELPSCRKVAVNGDGSKVRKNEYLQDGDLLIEGDVTEVLRAITDGVKRRRPPRERWFTPPPAHAPRVTPEPASISVERLRTAIVSAIAEVLGGWERPVLVDDSQMFGGLISERYELLPAATRVVGDHSGFVGAGLATATGLAIGEPGSRVLCTLGDQGFINGFQGLVATVEQDARVLFLVCNNGGSVSLHKQAGGSGQAGSGPASRRYLQNTPGLSYRRVAEALGVSAWRVAMDEESALDGLSRALASAAAVVGPSLVELELPSDDNTWRGIWITQGFERRTSRAGR